jgi:hypothetical protein
MDDGNGRKDRQALKRIVALLFALAALAVAAGARPRPIRVAVLWLLRAAEAIAWDFVIAVAEEAGVDPDLAVPLHAHDIADEAERLAYSFAVLGELLAYVTHSGPSPLPSGRIGGLVDDLMRTLRNLAPVPGLPERPLPDTS